MIPIIKNFFLDHQLLPKQKPVSLLVFLAMFLENGTQSAFSANTYNCNTSPTWIPERVAIHRTFRDLPENLLLLKSNNFSSVLILFNLASDLGIQLAIKTIYQL